VWNGAAVCGRACSLCKPDRVRGAPGKVPFSDPYQFTFSSGGDESAGPKVWSHSSTLLPH
jgi:hypothetical protein